MMNRYRKMQRGLGLPTAIFVITVMAFLAVVINQLVQSSAETTGEETNLIRAFYVAQSSVQFTLNEIFPPDGSASPICNPMCSGTTNYTGFSGNGLDNCSATVDYSSLHVDVDRDGSDEHFYTVAGTGTCGSVSRTVQIRAQ